MQPECFFDLAKELQQRSDEPAMRSSISRAYYAIYLAARALCDTEVQRNSKTSHKDVIDWYEARGKKDMLGRQSAGRISLSLKRLKAKRQQADYEMGTHIDQNKVDAVIGEVEMTFAELERFISCQEQQVGQIPANPNPT